MRRFLPAVSRTSALIAVLAGTLGAQVTPAGAPTGLATVSGQVTILERPGEVTEDLANVVVYLEGLAAAPRAKAPAPTNTVIALEKRQFSPRVRIVTEGSKVDFPNQDPWNHNVFSKTNGGFDTGVYGRNKSRDQLFREAGVYSLYCNVHPRMTAFVITLKTSNFTQPGGDGRFVLDNVAPGQYKLHVWHDRANEFTKDIVVTAAGVKDIRAELDARGYKFVQHKNKLGQVYTSTGDRY
jgi:plastocyanin